MTLGALLTSSFFLPKRDLGMSSSETSWSVVAVAVIVWGAFHTSSLVSVYELGRSREDGKGNYLEKDVFGLILLIPSLRQNRVEVGELGRFIVKGLVTMIVMKCA